MKKVFMGLSLTEKQREKLNQVSKEYEFIFDKNQAYDCEVLVGNWPANDLKNFKNLELLLLTAVGYDAFIKPNILNEKTILCNAVNIHSQEVSEHIVALLMSLLKNTHLYRDDQKNHLWKDEGVVKSINGLKVSIIGFGNIGNYLAKILKSMGMEITAVKRKMIEKPTYVDYLYTNNDLDKAISNADVIITVLPGTKENVHLFDLDTFKKMKNDAILINCGRGNLIDTEVLYQVLSQRIIKAAACDVFETEPLPEDSKLYELDNLLITPHVAGFFHLEEAKDDFIDLVCENLKHFINNEPLKYVVFERE